MEAAAGYHHIGEDDFIRMFNVAGDNLPPLFAERLAQTDTAWRRATRPEIEAYMLDVLRRITEELTERTMDENLEAFEKGWTENLQQIEAKGISAEALRPKYFRGSDYLRYNKTVVFAHNRHFEYDLFLLARAVIFWKFLRAFPVVYEFGCGSCANLLMLAELFPEKDLVGLDWTRASVEIAALMAEKKGLRIRGERFEFLNPSREVPLNPGAAVLTIHALEQLGDRFGPWLDFLIRNKPGVVVNYEPVLEFYDPSNLWDYLALLYSRKRGYLTGYLSALQRLADEGLVEILDARRPYLGGVVHEASLIVWRPL